MAHADMTRRRTGNSAAVNSAGVISLAYDGSGTEGGAVMLVF
jgi:hypothetical protein